MVGKRIATTAEGRPLVEALFTNAGLPPTDWTFVPSGFDPSPIVNDEADLFHGFRTGQGNLLELQGQAMNYVTYDQFDFPVYDAPIFVLDETLETQADLLTRWMRATIKGWEYAVANPDEVSELTVTKYGHEGIDPAVSANEAKLQVADIVSPETDATGLFTMTEERWRTILDFFTAAGTLTTPAEVGDVMTTAIQVAAMGGASKLLEP
jgi:ABC-type nitrate/sulfonate/bicarbonate transport system substrate-binding protein